MEVSFFIICAIVFGIIALIEGIKLFLKRNRIGIAVAKIIHISMPLPETMKIYNSKWAVVSFSVEGKIIISQNRIQVPFVSNLGDTITVKYDISNPQYLITQTLKKFILLIICSILAFITSVLIS